MVIPFINGKKAGKHIFFLVMIVLALAFCSCNHKQPAKKDKLDILKDTASLSGQKTVDDKLSTNTVNGSPINPAYHPQTVEIYGYIRGGGNVNITLDELSIGSINPLESIVVNPDGSFSVSTTIYEPGIYQLRLPNGAIHLFLRGGKVKVVSDISNLGKYEVTGSKESTQLRDMYYLLDKFNERTFIIQDRIETLGKDKSRKNELIRLIDSQQIYYSRITKDKSRELKQFINNCDTSMIAIMASFYLDAESNFDYLKMIGKKFHSICPNSKYYKQLEEKIGKIVVLSIGDNIPISAIKDPTGKEISMNSVKGKNLLVYFWASNNDQSDQPTKKLKQIYDRYRNRNFEVYAISFDNMKETWVDYINTNKLNWINVSYLDGWDQEVAHTYVVPRIPYLILVNKNGKIVDKGFDISQLEMKLVNLK